MKHIVMTPAIIAAAKKSMLEKLEAQLKNTRHGVDTTIRLEFTPAEVELEDPIILDFSGLAFAKQMTLVQNSAKEIAWHGIVRPNAKRNYFLVHDILVYPQTVTGVTVNTDEKKYEVWKQGLNDTQFNNLRMQAHSHVNMGVSPSGTDRTLYNNILQSLGKDSYYIFLIVNKSGNVHAEIYDLKNNAIYDNNDIVIMVEGKPIDDWYVETFETYIQEPKPVVTGYPRYPNSVYDDGYYEHFLGAQNSRYTTLNPDTPSTHKGKKNEKVKK